MKLMKATITILIVMATMLFSGCEHSNQIDIITSVWTADNIVIKVDNEYIFKDFTKEYTDDGCAITIRYSK